MQCSLIPISNNVGAIWTLIDSYCNTYCKPVNSVLIIFMRNIGKIGEPGDEASPEAQ